MMTTYESKPVAEWNVNDFLAYLEAEHKRIFGIQYAPFKSFKTERGMLGNWAGTKQKPGKYGPELTKRFIDRCLAKYRPTRDFPGVSFGWMTLHMAYVRQQVEAEVQAEQQRAERNEGVDNTWF
ncbi:hypothetical protein BCV50_00040 [Bacillus subtilis]|nr:hypothetical protein BCV50_00040 [Bacillus subtilis]